MKTIVAFQYFAGAAVTVEREWRTIHAALSLNWTIAGIARI